jgi:hypothetical protein
MTTATKTIRHAVVSLKLPTNASALVTYTQGILKEMTGNPAFPNPVPTLAALATAVNDLQTAQTAALTRAKGSATVRNQKRTALVQLLTQLKAYVQAQADSNPDTGASVIESAGLPVRKTPVRPARVFAAAVGANAGTANLVAPSAGHRASYEWEYSVDGGKTWTLALPTMKAKTTVIGLPSATVVQFRYRAVTPTGTSDWSAPVSLTVQ